MNLYDAVRNGEATSFYLDKIDPNIADEDRIKKLKERFEQICRLPQDKEAPNESDATSKILLMIGMLQYHLIVVTVNFQQSVEDAYKDKVLNLIDQEELHHLFGQEILMLAMHRNKTELDFIESKLDKLEEEIRKFYEL